MTDDIQHYSPICSRSNVLLMYMPMTVLGASSFVIEIPA